MDEIAHPPGKCPIGRGSLPVRIAQGGQIFDDKKGQTFTLLVDPLAQFAIVMGHALDPLAHGVALGKRGRDIPVANGLDYVYGYAVGLDMTRRDLQRAMGDEKKPWEIGKSFDHSAVLGPLHLASSIGHFNQGAIWLKVNGQTKQNANLNQMIWSVAEQIANLSKAFELMPGDIVYSGTPENVGPVVRGDVMDAHIDGIPDLRVRVV